MLVHQVIHVHVRELETPGTGADHLNIAGAPVFFCFLLCWPALPASQLEREHMNKTQRLAVSVHICELLIAVCAIVTGIAQLCQESLRWRAQDDNGTRPKDWPYN